MGGGEGSQEEGWPWRPDKVLWSQLLHSVALEWMGGFTGVHRAVVDPANGMRKGANGRQPSQRSLRGPAML